MHAASERGCAQLGKHAGLPSDREAAEALLASEDEAFLRAFHHALLEVTAAWPRTSRPRPTLIILRIVPAFFAVVSPCIRDS